MEPSQDARRLSPAEVKRLMASDSPPILIDVLPPDRFRKVHIPGAVNACVYEVVFLDQVRRLAPDTGVPVVVYGSRSRTLDAATAADKLVRAGYGTVAVLDGGIASWTAEGLPVEGEDPHGAEAFPGIEDGRFPVDTQESVVEWAGRNPNTRHHGTVRLSGGEIRVERGAVTGGLEIDMKSIRNVNLQGDDLLPVLEAHLASDDFFFTDRFPKAVLHIREALPIQSPAQETPNYRVRSELTLRGVSASLDFDATVWRLSDGRLAAEAHFDLDRTRWGVVYGSTRFFDHLGMHLVFDPVSVQVRIVTV